MEQEIKTFQLDTIQINSMLLHAIIDANLYISIEDAQVIANRVMKHALEL